MAGWVVGHFVVEFSGLPHLPLRHGVGALGALGGEEEGGFRGSLQVQASGTRTPRTRGTEISSGRRGGTLMIRSLVGLRAFPSLGTPIDHLSSVRCPARRLPSGSEDRVHRGSSIFARYDWRKTSRTGQKKPGSITTSHMGAPKRIELG